jgi:NTP pyrophosphatase (non-canonical NTP hydrolase)
MDLRELQTTVDEWVKNHGGYWDEFQILARMVEELGELSSDLQRFRGLRPRPANVDLPAEIGDLLFTLACFANIFEVNLEQALRDTLKKYNERDSEAWKSSRKKF